MTCSNCNGLRFVPGPGDVLGMVAANYQPCPVCHPPASPKISRSEIWKRMRDLLSRGPIEIPRIMIETPPVSEDDWVAKAIEGMRDKMAYEGGVLGVDLAQGRSETWEMRYDWETGKMIYRKLDPADMVRRDEEGEGSPDDGSD